MASAALSVPHRCITSRLWRSPRIAASEDPLYISTVQKASRLKKRKMEGSGRASPPTLSGTLPVELLDLVGDFAVAPSLPLEDAREVGSACGVSPIDLDLLDPEDSSVIDGMLLSA